MARPEGAKQLYFSKQNREFWEQRVGEVTASKIEGYITGLEESVKFLMTHTVFEPKSNTNRKQILEGIPTIMELMGWN